MAEVSQISKASPISFTDKPHPSKDIPRLWPCWPLQPWSLDQPNLTTQGLCLSPRRCTSLQPRKYKFLFIVTLDKSFPMTHPFSYAWNDRFFMPILIVRTVSCYYAVIMNSFLLEQSQLHCVLLTDSCCCNYLVFKNEWSTANQERVVKSKGKEKLFIASPWSPSRSEMWHTH